MKTQEAFLVIAQRYGQTASFKFYVQEGWGEDARTVAKQFDLTYPEILCRLKELCAPTSPHDKMYRASAMASFKDAATILSDSPELIENLMDEFAKAEIPKSTHQSSDSLAPLQHTPPGVISGTMAIDSVVLASCSAIQGSATRLPTMG